MICFSNPGELDIRAATTVGVNVKDGASPIGFFGTGMKIAIAVLLREGCPITIWCGSTQHDFYTLRETIRGQEFDCIHMRTINVRGECLHERLGWTTAFGKTWSLENAYRELWSNMTDEGGVVRLWEGDQVTAIPFDMDAPGTIESPPRGIPGQTLICVTGSSFEEVHKDRYETLLLEPARLLLDKTLHLEVYQGTSQHVYYKGIVVYKLPRPSLYTYNIIAHAGLTEDRTLIAGTYYLDQWIKRWMLDSGKEGLVFDALTTGEERHEGTIGFNAFDQAASGVFPSAMEKALKKLPRAINGSALGFHVAKRGTQAINWEPAVLTEDESTAWQGAVELVASWGYDYETFGYKLICTESVGLGCVGRADEPNKTAAITRKLIAQGDELLAALVEEFVHIRWGVADASLPMQNRLFSEIVRLGQEVMARREVAPSLTLIGVDMGAGDDQHDEILF